VQIAALVYGAHTLYQEKPHYLVFSVDRLEFVAQSHIDPLVMRFEESQTEHFAGLVQVFARRPEDPEEYQRFFDSVVSENQPDLERRPEFWEPWSDGAVDIRKQIKPLDAIKTSSPAEQEKVQQAVEKHTRNHPNLGVLPIGGIPENVGLLLDRDTLEIVDVIYANPWPTDDS
jgi:hypothetical protein